ncbi:hypothetical protein PAXRUDRAFT_161432 [Paxillus rubicundulus Ve08.2h10]|uniref:Uncharacterized protein n=1 Tax=Paxillus rubicundulus Ve08.2h10 TaxID=930991 RepID=A0A0D0D6T8_9AGAM|nr:hypothetical protein PAXRUDRAFT_161432 [Paxillus rubicundulus Ve08.2h10]
MSLNKLPEPIRKGPVVHMSGNTVLLDIKGIVPAWDMYMLSLDIKYPGEKVSIFFLHLFLANIIHRQTQSEDRTETSTIEQEQNEPDISIQDEEEPVTSQELEEAHGGYISCAVSPCCLLIRPDTVDGEPAEKYMVRAFDVSLIDKEIAKKRMALEEIREMYFTKRVCLV